MATGQYDQSEELLYVGDHVYISPPSLLKTSLTSLSNGQRIPQT